MKTYDPKEIYEIDGAPGSFVALDVRLDEIEGTIAFHDTARVRIVPIKQVKLKPLTLTSWNRNARTRHNAQAPKFSSRLELIRALRKAVEQVH